MIPNRKGAALVHRENHFALSLSVFFNMAHESMFKVCTYYTYIFSSHNAHVLLLLLLFAIVLLIADRKQSRVEEEEEEGAAEASVLYGEPHADTIRAIIDGQFCHIILFEILRVMVHVWHTPHIRKDSTHLDKDKYIRTMEWSVVNVDTWRWNWKYIRHKHTRTVWLSLSLSLSLPLSLSLSWSAYCEGVWSGGAADGSIAHL